jgi:hypothetical protein
LMSAQVIDDRVGEVYSMRKISFLIHGRALTCFAEDHFIHDAEVAGSPIRSRREAPMRERSGEGDKQCRFAVVNTTVERDLTSKKRG